MTDNAQENGTKIVVRPDAPIEWGKREEVAAVADRLAVMLPNAGEFTRGETMAAAQYCAMMGLNPFRGEVYFYKSRGKMVVVDGYKALARWANEKSPFDDRYDNLEPADGELFHVRCWILRDDQRDKIKEYVGMGATFREAFELVATYADGVVTETDTKTKQGQPKDPPTGWDWPQVARKRAFKNALNLSHGAPSPREMAHASFNVNGDATEVLDWVTASEIAAPGDEQRALVAQQEANVRQAKEKVAQMTAGERKVLQKETNDLLFGDAPVAPPPMPEPPPEPDTEPEPNGRPWNPETLRKKLQARADGMTNPPTSKQAAAAIASLGNVVNHNDDHRHSLIKYLFDRDSSHELTSGECSALIAWIDAKAPDYTPSGYAIDEAARVVRERIKELGQEEFPVL